jgi:hypothetical protein
MVSVPLLCLFGRQEFGMGKWSTSKDPASCREDKKEEGKLVRSLEGAGGCRPLHLKVALNLT